MSGNDPVAAPASAAGGGGALPLIYDLGMHRGEDSLFYLKKGFRVVAVEADPDLCSLVAERLGPYIEDGRLEILNLAIAGEAGTRAFYRSERTEWSTLRPEWVAIKQRKGAHFKEIAVTTATVEQILETHGEPYFLKIDIEGMDGVALTSLSRSRFRPPYVSVEASLPVEDQFSLLLEMGYDRFKIVQQRWVKFQKPPWPAREGRQVDHLFPGGASGLFGEEAPGRWLTAQQALKRYRRIFRMHRLYGDAPLLGGRALSSLLTLLHIHPGWHDTHARHGSVSR